MKCRIFAQDCKSTLNYQRQMKLNVLSLIFMLAGAWLTVTAQDDVNMKFGKPTKEEMQMTEYKADPSAEAVVLCRLTDVEYTVQATGYLADYHEKVRIKVLKPNGARFAKVVVPYQVAMSVNNNISGLKLNAKSLPQPGGSSNSYFEGEGVSMTEDILATEGDDEVESIKATAFNMEGSKVVKTALKKSDIVKKKIDEHNCQVEFTIPNVKEGTVIEYEYTIHSQLFWQLRDWYAQCEIPVVYAKLDMNIPSYLIFNIEDHGIQRLTYTCTAGTLNFKLESDPLAKQTQVRTNHYVYVGRNLTALPKDDYVWDVQDYCAGITAELKQYRLPGAAQMDYAKTWEQIDEMILTSDDLGIHLNDHSPLHEALANAKLQDIANEQERAAEVCRLVLNRVKWNGKYEIQPENTSETLKKGEGSNADINLLLIQTLRGAGFTADPVVLRQRDKGLLPYNFPSIGKLSTYIVGITLKNGTIAYVDASSAGGYLNALPEVLLVEKARLVKKKGSQWVNLQKVSRSQTTTVIEAELNLQGKLTGKQTTNYRGLAALKYRQQTGKTNEFAPEANEETTISKQGEVNNGVISINPFNVPPIKTNPFTADSRLMPVEFPSELTNQISVNITLPEGYTLASEPVQTAVTTPDKGVSGRFTTSMLGGKAQIKYLFNINKVAHSDKNYDTLRGMFDIFSKYCNEKLVFKKQ